jgi:biopolymer transport protein ExbD
MSKAQRIRQTRSWAADYLRTKYRPRSRLGRGLVGLAPWIDTLLVCGLLFAVAGQVRLQPGMVLELPRAPFAEGLRARHVVLVYALREGAALREVAFFRDEQFALDDPGRLAALRAAFGRLGKGDDGAIVVYADAATRHGTLTRLVSCAREAGVARIDLATGIPSPTAAGGGHE